MEKKIHRTKNIIYVFLMIATMFLVFQIGSTVTAEAAQYTVTYDANADDVTGTTADSTHTYGTASSLTPNGFSRNGYTFKEWNTRATGLGIAYQDGQSVTDLTDVNGATVTLYAMWVKEIDVTKKWNDEVTGTAAQNREYPTLALTKADVAYAVYDSTDKSLTFFRDIPNKYTDKQAIGTKTYYTNIENTPNNPAGVSWNLKTIESVVFKDVISPKSTSCWFYNCRNLTSLDLRKLDTSKTEDMSYMFYECRSLGNVDFSNFETANSKDMKYMFYNCKSMTNIDLTAFDTRNVENMSNMFEHCANAEYIKTESFSTEKVQTLSHMFYNCQSLKEVDLRGFDTKNAQSIRGMFYNCGSLTDINLETFDTRNVTDMQGVFERCYNLNSVDVSNFNTTRVRNMRSMFLFCSSLSSIDLSSFDTSSVRYMGGMFSDCSDLSNLNILTFNTESVTEMDSMFSGCSTLTELDLSSFDTSAVSDANLMFNDCTNLTDIFVSDKWDFTSVTNSVNMFTGDTLLPNYIPGEVDKTHANYETDGYLQFRAYAPETPSVSPTVATSPNLPTVITPPDWIAQDTYYSSADTTRWSKISDDEWVYSFIVRDGSYGAWESYVPDHYSTEQDENHAVMVDRDSHAATVTNIRTYEITFHPQGGTYESETGTTVKKVHYHETFNNSVGYAERLGFIFDGWFTEEEGGHKVFDAEGNCTTEGGFWNAAGTEGIWVGSSDIDLYAQWTELATLKVTKTINEENVSDSEKNIEFTFNINIGTLNETIDGVEFVDGQATITLKHGQSKTIRYLPIDTEYTVTEVPNADYPLESKTDDSGTLVSGETKTAAFNNERRIAKGFDLVTALSGNYADNNDSFLYIVDLTGLDAETEYTFTSQTNEPVTFTTSDTGDATVNLTMKRGQKYSINSVPKGSTYQITQDASTYIPSYEITNSGNGGAVVSENGSASRNETLSTDVETVDKNENITVTFTGNRVMPVASGNQNDLRMLWGLIVFLTLCAIIIVLRKSDIFGNKKEVE